MELKYNLGIAEDPRSEDLKALDYSHEDMAKGQGVVWAYKEPKDWKHYSLRDQDGSLSCCGQSAAKAIEIFTGVVESAHPIYRSRINFPSGGMYLQNLGYICKNIGTIAESLDASQRQDEDTMNRPISTPTPTKIAGYVTVNPKDIDAIAEAIEAKGHCMLIVHGSNQEWQPVPIYNPTAVQDLGHCICAVEYILWEGKKALVIEDSWGRISTFGNGGQRVITEDYLKARFVGAMYFTGIPVIDQFKPKFETNLTLGSTGKDVVSLQRILVSKGFLKMPSNVMYGYYGDLTKKAVIMYQHVNDIDPSVGFFGPITRGVMNKELNG